MAGSLRARSYNRALLRAVLELAPSDVDIEVVELDSIPLYNREIDSDETRPAVVEELKQKVHDADGLLVVTPEYNHSVPGVLKNALDWLSRKGHGEQAPTIHKPVGLMGAAPGIGGSIRAQQHLKQILLAMLAQIFPHGGVVVSSAGDKFDDDLNLTDERTRKFVASYVEGLAAWVRHQSTFPAK